MLCEKCGKAPATVYYEETVNGVKQQAHLCQSCADGLHLNFGSFELDPLWLTPQLFREKTQSCPNCGLTLREFSKSGKFGCRECYRAFSDQLPSLLKKIHGRVGHVGKLPKRTGGALRRESEIRDLRAKMKEAVQAEQFETAAALRDKIKRLEEGEA